jgi:hypothetical protein
VQEAKRFENASHRTSGFANAAGRVRLFSQRRSIYVALEDAVIATEASREPYAPSFGAQIEPSSMMAQTHGLPTQGITDFSVVFVGP